MPFEAACRFGMSLMSPLPPPRKREGIRPVFELLFLAALTGVTLSSTFALRVAIARLYPETARNV